MRKLTPRLAEIKAEVEKYKDFTFTREERKTEEYISRWSNKTKEIIFYVDSIYFKGMKLYERRDRERNFNFYYKLEWSFFSYGIKDCIDGVRVINKYSKYINNEKDIEKIGQYIRIRRCKFETTIPFSYINNLDELKELSKRLLSNQLKDNKRVFDEYLQLKKHFGDK